VSSLVQIFRKRAKRSAVDLKIFFMAAVVKVNIERFEKLTSRGREVFQRVASGRINKQVAFDLRISE